LEKAANLEQLKSRFRLRLAIALDGAGYPAQPLERAKQLASAISVELSVASALVRGFTIPDIPQLMELVQVTGRQPGFFLDEHVPDFPEGTTVVKPVGPGEDLVVRLPKDMANQGDTENGLIYHRAKVEHGYGIEAGDYVIAMAPHEPVRATAEKLYLFFETGGAAVRRCVNVIDGNRAVFQAPGLIEVPMILPLAHGNASAGAPMPQQFTQIVANLRGGTQLHMHA
jgi:hypothetical protein